MRRRGVIKCTVNSSLNLLSTIYVTMSCVEHIHVRYFKPHHIFSNIQCVPLLVQ